MSNTSTKKPTPDDDKPVLFQLRPDLSDDELQKICDQIAAEQVKYWKEHGVPLPDWAKEMS